MVAFMLKGIMRKKLIITMIAILGTLYGLGNVFSLVLHFDGISLSSFENKFSSVHFMTPGNDFGGSFFRLPTKSVNPVTVNIGTIGNMDTKECTKQVRGIYFNSQRGKRLRPIDEDTLQILRDQNATYYGLAISGGFYTTCDSGNNYGIFGLITYQRGGITTYLAAGTKLDYTNNKIMLDMANIFQYFDNKVPIGYIYDSYGGIGYVGGLLTGHEQLIDYLDNGGSINSGFMYSGDVIVSHNTGRETTIQSGNSAMETMRNIIVQGSVGLSKIMEEKERLSFLGNVNEKTVIYNGSDINSSTVINFAKQRAQELCQGQDPYTSMTLGPRQENIICADHDLTIDLNDTTDYMDKTIIVRGGNVLLENGMDQDSPPLDLFIDRGTLSLPDPIGREIFDDQGFPTTTNPVTSGLFLKGNFIINGLIVGNGIAPFEHKLHVQGKITLLNTPTLPTQARKDQITNLLGTSSYEPYINLQNVFTRACGLSGTAISDDTPCGSGNAISMTPLVILNGNYPSNLLAQ